MSDEYEEYFFTLNKEYVSTLIWKQYNLEIQHSYTAHYRPPNNIPQLIKSKIMPNVEHSSAIMVSTHYLESVELILQHPLDF